MKMQALHSFLISLIAHVWGLVLLSLVFVYEQKPPEPERIEVQFLKLPAPLEGSSVNSPEATRSEPETKASLGKAARLEVRPREQVRKRRGPRVEYRVRVAKATAPVEARESGTWVPASRMRLRESAVHDSGSRIAGMLRQPPIAGRPLPATARHPKANGRKTSSTTRAATPGN
jgi:hypothetical protein